MVTDEQIARINELSKKSKSVGLTNEEAKEQQELRQEYVKSFRTNLSSILDNVAIKETDGTVKPLKRKPKQ